MHWYIPGYTKTHTYIYIYIHTHTPLCVCVRTRAYVYQRTLVLCCVWLRLIDCNFQSSRAKFRGKTRQGESVFFFVFFFISFRAEPITLDGRPRVIPHGGIFFFYLTVSAVIPHEREVLEAARKFFTVQTSAAAVFSIR